MLDKKNKMLPATTTAWQKTGGWAGGQMARIYSQLGCSGDKIPSDLEGVFVIDGWRIHVVAASKKKSLTRVYVELPRDRRIVPAGRMRQIKVQGGGARCGDCGAHYADHARGCRDTEPAATSARRLPGEVPMRPAQLAFEPRRCEHCDNPAGDGPCEVCDQRWLDTNAEAFRATCAKEVVLPSYNGVTAFLESWPVGTAYRVSATVRTAGASYEGFTDYRVTRYTADTVYGVQIRTSAREMAEEETR